MLYYLCPTVGAGTETDPRRPKAADYAIDGWAAAYSSPDGTQAIVAVLAAPEVLAQLDADPDVILLGDAAEAMTSAEYERIAPGGVI